MRAEFGLFVESVLRPVMAPLRPRKATIPFRSGAIDFGAKYRDEMTVVVNCGRGTMTRDQLRELSYVLSRKGQIIFWDEPNKYYYGRIYDNQELTKISTLDKFQLKFICDPCAYGDHVTLDFVNRINHAYKGTEETPCVIQIANNNNYAIKNITITLKEVVR